MPQQKSPDLLDTSQLLSVLIAFKKGDFSVRLPEDQTGMVGKIYDTLNEVFERNERMAQEFSRISKAVGKEGRINQRATLNAGGTYAECIESVNSLITDLVQPSTEVARVIGAVAKGDPKNGFGSGCASFEGRVHAYRRRRKHHGGQA
jgi:methyl-accepting chemotaxis protein